MFYNKIGYPVDEIVHDGTLTALGIEEIIPNGWTFDQIIEGDPALKPNSGGSGKLEFAWIVVPASPIQLVYTVNHLGEDPCSKINGLVKYRTDKEELTKVIEEICSDVGDITVKRWFSPPSYKPGESVKVNIGITFLQNPDLDGIAIIETVPIGLSPRDISDEGNFVESNRQIRWFFYELVFIQVIDEPRKLTISYTVTPPSTSEETYLFDGGIVQYSASGVQKILPIQEQNELSEFIPGCVPRI